MEKRQIRMQDGRYLIFYTFADKAALSRADDEKDARRDVAGQPDAKPEAEEERRV
jgi:hypothetical protein